MLVFFSRTLVVERGQLVDALAHRVPDPGGMRHILASMREGHVEHDEPGHDEDRQHGQQDRSHNDSLPGGFA